jgi:hypothetical protein
MFVMAAIGAPRRGLKTLSITTLLCALFSVDAVAAIQFIEYENFRFGFRLRYPAELVAGPEHGDGSGCEVHSANGDFKVFAFAMPLKTSAEDAIEQTFQSESQMFGRSIIYKEKGKYWFVITGVANNGLGFYSKAYANPSAMTFLRMTYPNAQHDVYGRWMTAISRLFVPSRR